MKIPRTINQQYEIVRAADEEQRKRKTSVKRDDSSSSTTCRRIMLTPDLAIYTIQLPVEGDVTHTPLHKDGSDSTPLSMASPSMASPSMASPSMASPSMGSMTPHACSFESQPNDPW